MLEGTSCCGVTDFNGLVNGTNKNLVNIAHGFFYDKKTGESAFILITDTTKSGRGQKLIDKIERLKLGTISKQPARKNPNSGNMLKAWLWGVDIKKFDSWYNKNKKKYGEYYE